MTRLLSFLLLITVFTNITAQSVNESGALPRLQDQAGKMGKAFLSADYKAFVNYIYPKLIQMAGGKDKMTDLLVKSINEMKSGGVSFSKVSFDEPAKITKKGSELQSTLSQHLEMKLSHGRIVATSTLIAISKDNGITWTFLDTTNKDITAIKKIIPNLSSEIIIPPQQQPVRYND